MRPESFTFRDGTTNQLNHFGDSGPLVLLLPAMGVRASYYPLLAERLSDFGMQVVSVDYRGLGKSSVRASREVDFGYETLVQDIHEVVNHLKKNYPERPLFFLGHSLGGQVGLLYAARYPDSFRGFVIIASCTVYHKSWTAFGRFRILFGASLFRFLSQIVGFHQGKYLGFGGREARTVMRDWSRNAWEGRYLPQGSDFDYEAALAQLLTPTLAINIEGDDFAPLKATEHLLNKLSPQAPKTYKIYTHEAAGQKLDHFNWVKHNQALVPMLTDWIKRMSK